MPGSRTGKPIKAADWRDFNGDDKLWVSVGTVNKPDALDAHFEIVDDDGTKDILVEVLLAPGGEQITARLGSAAGGAGRGLWRIPAVGTEVAVLLPSGELDGDPVILATMSTDAVPDGINETILILRNDAAILIEATNGDTTVKASGDVHVTCGAGKKVYVRDGASGGEALVTKSEFNAHVHALPPLVAAGSPVEAPSGPGPAPPSAGNVAAPTPVTGTTILVAK